MRARSGVVIGVLACAGIVASLMQTLLVPLLPDLPNLLHTTPGNAAWALTSTLLAAAVATPVLGRLGDMYGKRMMLLVCAGFLVVGSVICAVSSSLVPVVAGRAVQGLGMAVIPLGISIMRDVLPRERLGSAVAVMSASLGVGGSLGLPASAAVAQHANWHVLLWGSAGLSLIFGLLIAFFVPESGVRAKGRFDVLGALGLLAGLTALLLAISEGATWGWTSTYTIGLFVAAPVVLVLWGLWELWFPSPIADLRITARRQVLLTNLASIVIGFAMYGTSLIAPQILEMSRATGYGLGQSMIGAGLWMLPAGLLMMAVAPLAARLSAARGPKVALLAGTLVIALGYALGLGLMGAAWGIMIVSAVVGCGVGLAYAAMPTLIMGAVPASETAAANGLNSLMRSIGTSLSSTVIGVVLAHLTIRLGGLPVPSRNGFRTGFLLGAAVSVAAAVVVLTIPGRRPAGAGGTAQGARPSSVQDIPR